LRFVADESVDSAIVDRLRRDGHEGLYVAETQPGIADEAVLELANRDAAVLLTADKDFGELVFRQRRLDRGVVLLRLAGLSGEAKARKVAAAVATHDDEMGSAFSVVSPGLVRIRRRS
jgi:predicted nuclease of predicted toxin-antitoxin system